VFAQAAQRPPEGVAGAGIDTGVLAAGRLAHRDVDADPGSVVSRGRAGPAGPPHSLDAVLAAYSAEGRRLVDTAQAVDLLARALRGEVFRPQLRSE
jgi:hypothetical protein